MTASTGDLHRQLRQLFEAGSAVGLTDGELIERCADRRDESAEAAFETILVRHGALVLAVCRQVLGDLHAAEDAFQATFLVLVRRAGSLRVRAHGSLGPWLYGVAYRTAMKARTSAARRRAREHRVALPEARAEQATAAAERDDLSSALHQEVNRLPAKYRAAVVLCYFEGRTHDEAAAALQWPVGTVRSYLSRARDLLHTRLTRRGLAPAGLVGMSLLAPGARAEVPAAVRDATIAVAIKGTPAGAGAAALANLVLRSLLLARWKTTAAGLSAVLMAAGLGLVLRGALGSQPRRRPDPAPAAVAPARPPSTPVDLLPAHARARLGILGFHHGSVVNQAVYTRDGQSLVTIDIKRVVSMWEATTGRLLHQMALSGDLFDRIAVSPDGTMLATTEPNPNLRLRLWDLATGRERRRWHVAKDTSCQCPAFSPDGRTLMTWGTEYDPTTQRGKGFIDLWDVAAPTERRRRLAGNFREFELSPDGQTLAWKDGKDPNAVINGSVIRLWDLATGRERAPLSVEGLAFFGMAFSPDGKLLVASLTDGTIRVYHSATGRERLPRLGPVPEVSPRTARGNAAAVSGRPPVMTHLAFSPDGAILAGGSTSNFRVFPSSGAIHLWDFARGKELRRFGWFPGGVGWLSFAPDGKTLASAGSWEPIVRLWDVATGEEAFPQPGHVQGVSALAISPADGTIFTGSYDGTVRRWEAASGRALGLVARFQGGVLALAIAPDGRTLLVGGHFGDLSLWSVEGRREIHRLHRILKNYPARQVAYSPDGKTVAAERTIWDVASGEVRAVLRARDEPKDYLPNWATTFYSPDGRRVITAEPGGARIWDLASGEEVHRAVRTDKVHDGGVALSADARFLATGGSFPFPAGVAPADSTIRIWELDSGQEVATLPGHEDAISGLVFSPDGRLLASHSGFRNPRRIVFEPQPQDRAIQVWDLTTGRELRRFEGHRGAVNALTFTPDGRSVVSSSEDATALVWDVSDLKDREKAEPLTAESLEACWGELAGHDARAAYRASWALSVASAVPFLRDRLRPATVVAPNTAPEVLRTVRAIAVLERIGTPEARSVIERLAHGDPGAPETREAKATLDRPQRARGRCERGTPGLRVPPGRNGHRLDQKSLPAERPGIALVRVPGVAVDPRPFPSRPTGR